MPISKAGTCSSAGFSLIELIVVMFMLSLVLSVVLPTFAGFGEGKLKAEAREIASILRYVQDSSASRKQTFLVKFDFEKNVVSWKEPEGNKAREFVDLTGVELQSKGLVSKGELILFFEPLGIRENVTVYMQRDSKSMEIILHHLSGKVEIKSVDEG
ncbi:MAG: prepilin-type N-terminal cleavage/methylation domain-containing protein [Nitrospirota bacterium]